MKESMLIALKRALVRDEGLRLKPYKDSVGKLSIGIGRNLEDVGISREEAEHLLESDIDRTAQELYQKLPWIASLTDERQLVLLNMAFNLGVRGLLSFTRTLAHVQAGRYEKASLEMLNSKWASQVGTRAIRLAKLMKDGHA